MDLFVLLERYLHRQVAIVTSDRMRLQGTLSSVTDGCIRLTMVKSSDACESTGWYEQMQSEEDPSLGPRWPEVLIQLHYICAVTCLEDDILDQPFANELPVVEAPAETVPPEKQADDFLDVPPLHLQLGGELLSLVSEGGLPKRLTECRNKIAAELGTLIPKVWVTDALSLPPREFRVRLHEAEIARAELRPRQLLALPSGEMQSLPFPHEATLEPTFGTPAFWIDPRFREEAAKLNCTVVEQVDVIATLFYELLTKSAADLLTYDVVHQLLAVCRRAHSATVDTLFPQIVPLPTLHEILRQLLAEQVSIKNLALILESLGRHIHARETFDELLARVRIDLGRWITAPLIDDERRLHVVCFDAALEAHLTEQFAQQAAGLIVPLSQRLNTLVRELQLQHPTRKYALLTTARLRTPLWRSLQHCLPGVSFLAREELIHPQPLHVGRQVSLKELTKASAAKNVAVPRRAKDKPR